MRRHRNRLIHSTYVFLEGGGELVGVLRSDISKGKGPDVLAFDQEDVAVGSFDDALAEIGRVALELSLCRTQLIGWSRPVRG